MKNNKTYYSRSYSSLHYNYFNPKQSTISDNNKSKRKRLKDSYVDIANEKKDFISFEINQKEFEKLYTQITLLKTKSQSKSANNSNFFHKKIKFEIKKKGKPYKTLLRSQSTILNKRKFESIFDNKIIGNNNNYKKSRQRKTNQRKINMIDGYKFSNNNKYSYINSLILKDKKTEKKEEENKNNNNEIAQSSNTNLTYNKENNKSQIINFNKNNNYKNNSIISHNNNIIKKNNFEENKNNEENNKLNNTIHNSIQKIKEYIENKSFGSRKKKCNHKINNLKKRLLEQSKSCSSVNSRVEKEEKKNQSSSEEFKINKNENDILKENIKNILKSDRKVFEGNKSFYKNQNNTIKENTKIILKSDRYKIYKNKKANQKYSIYIKEDEYNDIKLKKLLSNIPNHNEKKGIKKYPDYMVIKKEKNISDNYESIKNNKCIMPPNNLEDLILKRQLNFLYK